MSSFNAGEAYIEMSIRQEGLKQDAKEVEDILTREQQKLQGVADKADAAGEKGEKAFDGITGAALKALAVMGTIEVGLGAINVGASLINGELDEAVDGIKRLPAGIGPVATQLESMLGTVTGISGEIERIEALSHAMEIATEANRLTFQGMADASEEHLNNLIEIERRIALLTAAPEDREVVRTQQNIERTFDQREAAIQADLEKAKQARVEAQAAARQLDDSITDAEDRLAQFTENTPDTMIRGTAKFVGGFFGGEGFVAARDNAESELQTLRNQRQRILDNAADAEKKAMDNAAQQRMALADERVLGPV